MLPAVEVLLCACLCVVVLLLIGTCCCVFLSLHILRNRDSSTSLDSAVLRLPPDTAMDYIIVWKHSRLILSFVPGGVGD